MKTEQPVAISRHDYTVPVWSIPTVHLSFDLHPEKTIVTSKLVLHRETPGELCLDGVDLKLVSVAVDGVVMAASDYTLSDTHLVIDGLPDDCELTVVTQINPAGNTALEGLYLSSGNFCTQCEAEGFRKITYFLDRPDVLSVYTVQIKAPKAAYPVLLSNGNFVSESIEGEFGLAQWHDPHPKPCYLFALVAGDLSVVKDTFTTTSGKSVDLHIYVEAHNLDKCEFAMGALKRSMRWDEEVYGLEYDLERFMIVAVDDFNMGAMENKGLNVFNSKFVLADVETATDTDFIGVEAVIAHEYFHNWTGNRVTCRDWFQLSLKEGLTVFRDQEFTADMHDRTVKRIEDVRLLRARQFPEDAGPMAHPIRPESFIEINNFYTLTIYEKGAEVIRMMHTLLGADDYRKGIDLYFERHDGQAVTCDDFIAAMQDASGVDLKQFSLWYSQAGTPQLEITESYDERDEQYTLTLKQHCPDTPGQTNKQPMHIPILMGLMDETGDALPVGDGADSMLLQLTQEEQSFRFKCESRPILSPLRQFSAPVNLNWRCRDQDLAVLLASDTDAFNRWDASQRLVSRVIERALVNPAAATDYLYLDAIGSVLNDDSLDAAIKAEVLSLPSLDTLAEGQEVVDIEQLHTARLAVRVAIANRFKAKLTSIVQAQLDSNDAYVVEHTAIGKRSLANCALSLLNTLPEQHWLSLASAQYKDATNMTDRVAALQALMFAQGADKADALADFYQRFESQRLVIDKWFTIQAMTPNAEVIDTVKALAKHSAFELSNPNRVRSLIGAFASGNPVGLHSGDGSGYKLLAEYVLKLDATNPQIAARLITPLTRWKRFAPTNAALMKAELQQIVNSKVSADVYEIVFKSLED